MSKIEKIKIPINGQLVLFDIGGSSGEADWNASQGEAGYIKNRTHYAEITQIDCLNGYTAAYNSDGFLTFSGQLADSDDFKGLFTNGAIMSTPLTVVFKSGRYDGKFEFAPVSFNQSGIMYASLQLTGVTLRTVYATIPFSYELIITEETGTPGAAASGVELEFIGIETVGEVHKLDKMYLPYIDAASFNNTGEKFNSATSASGMSAHAEGNATSATGTCSHAEGSLSKATKAYSHAEGYNTSAEGQFAHTEGQETIATGLAQHVQGQFNIANANYAHIIGGGISENTRKNIHTVDWSGNAVYAGDVTATAADGSTVSLLSLKNATGGGGGGTIYTAGVGISISQDDVISISLPWAEETSF